MTSRRISLQGTAARGAVISASVLHELLGVVLEGSHGAVRLLVEGRSTGEGTVPSWLDEAAAFDVVGFEAGSTQVLVQTRPLREALERPPSIFGAAAALDVLAWGLRDALAGHRDSERFDAHLLRSFGAFGRVLSKGFHAIELGGDEPVLIDASGLQAFAALEAAIPRARRVRVTGVLEEVEPRRFELRLTDGSTARALVDEVPQDRLASSSGRKVVVSGLAVFKPSGALLRIEATSIEEPRRGAEIWAKPPVPLFGFAEPAAKYRVPQTSQTGINAIMGTWPGDEDDDTVDEVLELIS